MAQQQATPLLPPSQPPPSSSFSSSSPLPLTLQEQEQLNRLQNVIAATNLNLDETEKQIGGVVYTPRWSDPVWVEPDSVAVLVAYCLPGEFAESGQEISGGGVGFELEVLESYEVALPQNFTAWMMVIGNEDRQNRYPAAIGVICASDANDAETRVVSAEEQQINNVVQQFSTTTSIDQVINNVINNNNNATNQNTTGGDGGGTAPPPASLDTTRPTLNVPNDMTLRTTPGEPNTLLVYSVTAQDDRDGTATLDEDNQLIQGSVTARDEENQEIQADNVGGNITISCTPSSQYFLSVGNRTVQCHATDAAGNQAEASFKVSVTHHPVNTPTSGITVSANPTTHNGPCPTTIEFGGTITDISGANRDVVYRFVFSTGATTEEQVIRFNEPGSQTVSYRYFDVDTSLQGSMAIEILQPVQLQSNQAQFQITCTPSTVGAAPPAPQTLLAENDTTTARTDEEEDTTAPPPPATDDDEEEEEGTGGGGTGSVGTEDAESPPPATDDEEGPRGGTGGGGTGGDEPQ